MLVKYYCLVAIFLVPDGVLGKLSMSGRRKALLCGEGEEKGEGGRGKGIGGKRGKRDEKGREMRREER